MGVSSSLWSGMLYGQNPKPRIGLSLRSQCSVFLALFVIFCVMIFFGWFALNTVQRLSYNLGLVQ